MSNMSPFTEFSYDVSLELLWHVDNLERGNQRPFPGPLLSNTTNAVVITTVPKRYRLIFFNKNKGRNHTNICANTIDEPKTHKNTWWIVHSMRFCDLGSSHRRKTSFEKHQTTYVCKACTVPLFLSVPSRMRKNRWTFCHFTINITPEIFPMFKHQYNKSYLFNNIHTRENKLLQYAPINGRLILTVILMQHLPQSKLIFYTTNMSMTASATETRIWPEIFRRQLKKQR